MSTKAIWTIIIIIIVVIIGYFMFRGGVESPTTTPGTGTTTDDVPTETPDEPEGESVTVMYTDEGFSPSPVTIKVGDTVTFVNTSSGAMWVASAMHPTHMVYSGTELAEHCGDETDISFDQCESAGADGTYSFTFTKAGTWNYHNHVDSTDFGSVVVEE
ncbi:hypothetical protein L0Y40_00655 [Candidatus Wolfebacteria bacterium]|nr:hypothetical protein [Candidatus Wolfebacteria bacterium]